jgi:hypothetical protein
MQYRDLLWGSIFVPEFIRYVDAAANSLDARPNLEQVDS